MLRAARTWYQQRDTNEQDRMTDIAFSSFCFAEHVFPTLVRQFLGDLLERHQQSSLVLRLLRSKDDRLLPALDLDCITQLYDTRSPSVSLEGEKATRLTSTILEIDNNDLAQIETSLRNQPHFPTLPSQRSTSLLHADQHRIIEQEEMNGLSSFVRCGIEFDE